MKFSAVRLRVAFPFVACAAIVMLLACSDTSAPKAPYFTASVNGTGWSANYLVNVAVGDVFPGSGGADVVGGGTSSTGWRQITVQIAGFKGVGLYPIGSSNIPGQTYAYYIHRPTQSTTTPEDTNFMTQQAGAGVVTFTAYDSVSQQASGTFSFTATALNGAPGTVTITDGKFAGRMVTEPSPDAKASGDASLVPQH